MKLPKSWFSGLILASLLTVAPAEEVYFFAQTNLFGEVNNDWFNGDNWFVYDELGSLMPAATPPRDGQTAIISGLADVGTSLVRVNGLVLTNGATVRNGTFGLSDVVMCADSRFENSKVNLMGTLVVEGPGCALVGGTFKV